MNTLIVINDAPYGTEKAYNAFRPANQVIKDYPDEHIEIFLLADAVMCGITDQETPDGYYNIGRMIRFFVWTCMDARGIKETMFLKGVQRSNRRNLPG
jgi:uncharacterized protein involved in oxidation of intracellular sulfur